MRHKIEALPNYEELTNSGDGVALLKWIKNLMYSFQSLKSLSHSLHELKRRFYFCTQGRHTPVSAYMEKFQNCIDVIEHSGGSVGNDPGKVFQLAKERDIDVELLSETSLTKLRKSAQEQNLAAGFVLNSDRRRFGVLIAGMEKDFLKRQQLLPKDAGGSFQSPIKLEGG